MRLTTRPETIEVPDEVGEAILAAQAAGTLVDLDSTFTFRTDEWTFRVDRPAPVFELVRDSATDTPAR